MQDICQEAEPGNSGAGCKLLQHVANAWMAVLAWPKSRICWSTPSLMWGYRRRPELLQVGILHLLGVAELLHEQHQA